MSYQYFLINFKKKKSIVSVLPENECEAFQPKVVQSFQSQSKKFSIFWVESVRVSQYWVCCMLDILILIDNWTKTVEILFSQCGKRSYYRWIIEPMSEFHGEILDSDLLYLSLKEWPSKNFIIKVSYSKTHHEKPWLCVFWWETRYKNTMLNWNFRLVSIISVLDVSFWFWLQTLNIRVIII